MAAEFAVLSDLLDDANLIDLAAPALSDGTDSLGYGELVAIAGQVATALIALGVQPGDRVGVHLRKSVWSFGAVHGVIRAGAVMVPLDSFAPAEHTASVIVDASIQVVITDATAANFAMLVAGSDMRGAIVRSAVEAAPFPMTRWVDLDGLAVAAPVQVDADDDAYIIYTSGSTGRPKGIVHTHRSALAYVRLAAAAYGLRADDRLANIASLHFDQSTFELYVAPFVGCAVTVVPDAVLRFPASLSELVARERVTVWYSVPYVLRQMVTRGALDQRDLSAIRWVLYGGESYPPEELAALMECLPNALVSNVYGPAEVNQCTRHDVSTAVGLGATVPIGRAWGETELIVVDTDLRPTVDESGELLVSTTTMMDRYWNRPDLTAEAIVERAFTGRTGTRWYRTGDMVETLASGDLVFLGRADNQVKIRGQRVELESVDITIRQLDSVNEVAVIDTTVEGAGGPELALIAVVEPVAGAEVTLRQVQVAVAGRHPRVAVPVELVVVTSLARTATSKIDRNAVRNQVSKQRSS